MDPALEDYAERVGTTPRAAHLDALDARTRQDLGMGVMLSGPVVGALLATLVAVSGARRVLELGTFSGVSALTMAEALPPDGRLITCEADPERAAFARAAFAGSPWGDRIELREGRAADTLAALDGPFDLVFVDADKEGYGDYVDWALPRLATPRGLIVLDNTLLQGAVVDPDDPRGRPMHELNARLARRDDLAVVQLPVRDGVTLVRRRA